MVVFGSSTLKLGGCHGQSSSAPPGAASCSAVHGSWVRGSSKNLNFSNTSMKIIVIIIIIIIIMIIIINRGRPRTWSLRVKKKLGL